MCPEKARVLVVDDNENARKMVKEQLESAGHSVAAESESLPATLLMLDYLSNIDGALLDGNLSPYSEGGYDGAQIAEQFREKFPGKFVYSISSSKQEWSDDPKLTFDDLDAIISRITQAK